MTGARRLVVGALIVNESTQPTRVLAARRTTSPVGKWEFPGGKVEADETASDALVREILEELGVPVSVGQRLDPVSGGPWPISDSLEMELWWCSTSGHPEPGNSHDELRWLTADELGSVDWLDADHDALSRVAAGLCSLRWSASASVRGEGSGTRQEVGHHEQRQDHHHVGAEGDGHASRAGQGQ